MSSSEMTIYRLEDILVKIIDNRGKNPPFSMKGFPYIDTTCIVGDARYPNYLMIRKYVSEDTYNNWFRKGHPKENDLLIATVGANIGKICLMDTTEACIAQNTVGLRVDREIADPYYIYYLLTSKVYQNYLKSLDVGSAQPSIKVPHLLDIDVKIPRLDIQSKIAKILSDLDEKIELNCQTNQTLETIAQVIYKEWFVNFNFPGATGEMQDSELGPIPRGWRVGLLGEIVEFIKGVSYRSAELMTSKYALVTLKSIARGGGFNSDGFKEFDGRYKESQTLVEGDTVIAQTDITQNAEVVGCPAIVENPFNYEKLIASIDIVKCLSKNENLTAEGVYYFFRDQNFKDYCLSHTNGSTVLHLRSSELPNYKLAIPDKNILKKFCQIVRGINSKIMDNNHQTQTLIKMRDILMPKLMNGELEV